MNLVALAALLPLLPALAALLAFRLPGRTAANGITLAAAASLIGALALLPVLGSGPTKWTGGVAWLVVRWDVLAAVMTVLVAFIGTVVLRFSRRYLDGEPGQARFVAWLGLTLAAVLLLVLSGHLGLLLAAWVATSLSLHRLLLFYPQRPGARFAARKKFVISRIGDAALLTAAILLYQLYGTLEFDALFAAIAAAPSPGLFWAATLIGLCALCKSAQLPFHSWLPDTMDTPTPVSAFMHAGIINAGGFLLIRLSPVTAGVPGVLTGLAFIGALTAAFGAVVMLTQPAVKRALAYSTIAQMGFMILQCGLGAGGLALVHIVAHSLYKAHAFLISGSTIGAVPRAAIPLRPAALGLGGLVAALLVGGGMTLFHTAGSTPAVFILIIGLAVAYGLARRWSAAADLPGLVKATGLAVVIVGLSFVLHHVANRLVPVVTVDSGLGTMLAVAIFAALFLFQAFLWRAPHLPLARRIYVHALNGFYLGTLANRLLARLWPRHAVTLTLPR